MKEQDQIKAIAELDGWTPYSPGDFNPTPRWEHKLIVGKVVQTSNLPDYLQSYDAIIPVIEKQYSNIQRILIFELQIGLHNFWKHAGKDTTQFDEISWMVAILQATPQQLCEALLRATGRWTE